MKWYWKVYKTNGGFEKSFEELGCNWAPSYLDFLGGEGYAFVYVTFSDEAILHGKWDILLPNFHEISEMQKNYTYKGDVGLMAQRREKLKQLNKS